MNDRRRQPNDELNDLAGNIEQHIGQIVHKHNSMGNVRLEDVSRASAEAVLMQYEATAKEIEEFGESLRAQLAQDEADLLVEVNEAAAFVRAKGKMAQKLVDDIGARMKGAREALADTKSRIGG